VSYFDVMFQFEGKSFMTFALWVLQVPYQFHSQEDVPSHFYSREGKFPDLFSFTPGNKSST